MSASPTARSGKRREDEALAHLERHGLVLLARNYSCRIGEVDLVMRDDDTTVFVEVRYRRSAAHGGALASISRAKAWRVARAAQVYQKAVRAPADAPIRFDVVAIDGSPGQLRWLKAAFEF
ncbi:MAG: YraN family protein [Pseudomonadota bacterium]